MRRATPAVIGVVDDDVSILSLLSALLTEEGYQVATAGSVAATVDLLAAQPLAALLLDVLLPDGDTDVVVRALQAKGITAPPLIILSGGTPDQIADAQTASGAIAALRKPFDGDMVMGILEEIVSRPRRATTLERTLGAIKQRGRDPHIVRCPTCRWLLYVGAHDYVSGIFAGHWRGQSVQCPGCGQETPLPL